MEGDAVVIVGMTAVLLKNFVSFTVMLSLGRAKPVAVVGEKYFGEMWM